MTPADMLILILFSGLALAGLAAALALWCDLMCWAIDAVSGWIDRERAK
jgi:hypothetical protein